MTRFGREALGPLVLLVCGSCAAPPPPSLPTGDGGTISLDTPQTIACTPGFAATCMCNAMTRGMRFCLDDGTYSACQCVDARVACFPNAVQACVCGDFAGIQFCNEDGYFSGCMCPMEGMDAAVDVPPDVPRRDVLDAARVDRVAVDVVRDAATDRPDVCMCAPDAARLCPLPPGQVEATYRNGRCRRGTQACAGAACWGPCLGQVDPIDELCNNIDDNCNGLVDDIMASCGLGRCRRVMSTCEGGRVVPCMPDFTQRQVEACNGIDDDCNGMVDDGCRDF